MHEHTCRRDGSVDSAARRWFRGRCQRMSELIPNARGRPIQRTAHLPNIEDPESFGDLFAEFLTTPRVLGPDLLTRDPGGDLHA